MQRLLYISTPPAGLDAAQLEALIRDIRDASLRNNARDHLTGALAYSPHCFAQAIEGAPAHLDALLDRLDRDTRHRGLNILERRDIRARMFPDWAMAFAPVPEAAAMETMAPRDLLRFLIEAAQACEGVRAIPGFGLAPETRLRLRRA